MTARRVRLAALPALILVLGGCGTSASQRSPDIARLPLTKGAQIVTRVRQCDKGANAFCAWELVVVDPRYRSSEALALNEHRLLRVRGWSNANADTGEQRAADSPGHKLRVTYATAEGDLSGIDLGWIKRSRTVTLELSRAIFAHEPTMSMLLEVGST